METATATTGTISNWFNMKGSINVEGFIAFGVNDSFEPEPGTTTNRIWCFVTEDSGDTWDANLVVSTNGTASGRVYAGAIGIADRLSGSAEPIIYMARGNTAGTGAAASVFRSTDGGVNWTTLYTGVNVSGLSSDIHIPYSDNDANDHLFISGLGVSYARSDNGGTTWTKFNPDATYATAAAFHRIPCQTWTQDRQQLYAFTDDISGTSVTDRRFYVSANDGANWTFKSELPNDVKSAGGFPYNGDQFYLLTSAQILVSIDGGSNWINKTGNAPSLTFSGVGIGGVIVPVWVQE
jgi:hypothetical protein